MKLIFKIASRIELCCSDCFALEALIFHFFPQKFPFLQLGWQFPAEALLPLVCASCRRKLNFCSTVSVNKFDAVIELELHFFLFTIFILCCFVSYQDSSHAIDWHSLFCAIAVKTENVICRLSVFATFFSTLFLKAKLFRRR